MTLPGHSSVLRWRSKQDWLRGHRGHGVTGGHGVPGVTDMAAFELLETIFLHRI